MEEVLPPQTQEGAGFEPARVRQFTIFLENRVGRLQALVRALDDSDQVIRALSIEESGDTALVRIICSNSDAARETLRLEAFAFSESELIAVRLSRRKPHNMVSVCAALLAAEINIHYAYPFLNISGGPAITLYVDDMTLAAELLMKKGFILIAESDLQNLQ
ncbi:MAG: acetolactate synthase [Planctomycetota bacterium]|nr:acetolactate synthase [Planctomycetota bacterium]